MAKSAKTPVKQHRVFAVDVAIYLAMIAMGGLIVFVGIRTALMNYTDLSPQKWTYAVIAVLILGGAALLIYGIIRLYKTIAHEKHK